MQSLADATRIACALRCNPGCGVRIPLVGCRCEGSQASLDVFPAALVLERATDGVGDERTAMPRSDALIELPDQIIIQTYVYTHGHTIAHRPFWKDEGQ